MVRRVRHDGRKTDDLRPVRITPGFVRTADGSCLVEVGGTRVICTASFVEGVPEWRKGSSCGWVTAEYGMLPASTSQRKPRAGPRQDGRSVEIQRIIGRVLRTVVRMDRLGENTIYLDCDVLEADGGTRAAAVTGSYVALARAARKAQATGRCEDGVLAGAVAAVSVGVVEGRPLLDPDYAEDSAADVDVNVAMNSRGRFVEVQATGERASFDEPQLRRILRLAAKGVRKLLALQERAIRSGGRS